MKYIKKFNEELKPSTYKKAGARLRDMGHQERGINLLTYGHEKADDILNFWVGEVDSTSSFTNPIEASYAGFKVRFSTQKDFQHCNYRSEYQKEYWEKSMYEFIKRYKEGGLDLYLDIQIFFKISPRQVKQFKDISNLIDQRKMTGDETGLKDQYMLRTFDSEYSSFPLMTLRLFLSESMYYGDCDDEYKPKTDEDYHDYFEQIYYPQLYPIEGDPIIVKIGSSNSKRKLISTLVSRRDANKFKSKIIPEIMLDMNPLLQDLFSEQLQTKPENFEKAINAINSVSVNRLYKDKITQGGSTDAFRKQFSRLQ